MARFSTANALLASGQTDEAAAAFEAFEGEASEGFAADAAYARALVEDQAGAGREGSMARLTELLETCPKREEGEESPRVTKAQRDLDPRAVLQTWVRNYRERSPSAFASGGFGPVLALHGCDLAEATVVAWEATPVVAERAAEVPSRPAAPPPPPPAPEPEVAKADVAPSADPAPSPAMDERAAGSTPWVWIILGVILLVGVVLIFRRG